jgi:hypothetical protein
LYDKHLAPQKKGAIADSKGEWKHPGCHLYNVDRVRYVYALSVKAEDEAEVRRLFKEKKGAKTEDAMSKFCEYLNEKEISHQLSPPEMMIRKSS